jgi:hypothetical protein
VREVELHAPSNETVVVSISLYFSYLRLKQNEPNTCDMPKAETLGECAVALYRYPKGTLLQLDNLSSFCSNKGRIMSWSSLRVCSLLGSKLSRQTGGKGML